MFLYYSFLNQKASHIGQTMQMISPFYGCKRNNSGPAELLLMLLLFLLLWW